MPRRGRPPRKAVFERLETQMEEFRTRMGGLPNRLEAEAAAIWEGIWFEEAHHSTAIEGNTLVLRQVEALLAEGRTVGQKPLSEYMEVQGYAKAASWVYDHGVEDAEWTNGDILTLAEMRHVHSLAMGPVWDVAPHPDASPDERPGAFRKHDIQPFPGGMIPPPWTDVPALVSDWLEEASELRGGGSAFPLALARLHCRFEQIHPFLDGNGRAGRLVLNLMLVRLGYPPVIIYKRQRLQYLQALRRTDRGDTGALGRASGAGHPGQPQQVRHSGGCRARPPRSTRGARHSGNLHGRPEGGRQSWPPAGDAGLRWAVAEHHPLAG